MYSKLDVVGPNQQKLKHFLLDKNISNNFVLLVLLAPKAQTFVQTAI